MVKEEQSVHYITPPPLGIKIRARGMFDLPDFYRWLKLWLENNSYMPDERDLEIKYIERRKPPIKNYEIEWIGEKQETTYFTHKINLKMLIVAVKEAEGEWMGQKVDMEKGDAHINILGWVQTPNWENLSFLQRLYAKHIAYKRLRVEKVKLYKKVYIFQNDIKQYLGVNQ
ncbi:hypothetical protein CL622_01155 [archaeon]|nr:hypothetical protein [archaeon]|tara:strand:+ start:1183 stop:1695 length:513 start_codon:yes stop_codon:yes gene_type:complete